MHRSAVITMLVSLMLFGCAPSISDEDAQQVIKESLWNEIPTCKLRPTLEISKKTANEAGYRVNQYPPPFECAKDLAKAGLAEYYFKPTYDDLNLVPKGAASVQEYWFAFKCGSRDIERITSKLTEKDGVVIRYERKTLLNKGLIDSLSNCPLEVPKDGTEEIKIIIRKDDKGKWTKA